MARVTLENVNKIYPSRRGPVHAVKDLTMTVDNGVHSYRRWEELGFDTAATQRELFDPLTGSALTTVMGYAGMVFAHHQGLRSIGSLAVLGLTCCWISGVALMPGILRIRERAMKQRKGPHTPSAVEPDQHHVQV